MTQMPPSVGSEEEERARPRPVHARERLVLLDVLRGFALGGVFLSNVHMWFSGKAFLPKPRLDAITSARVDVVFGYLYGFLISGKFVTIFSFLFGLGFAVQMIRAEERGGSVVPVYARRLFVMLLLGLTHMFALWYGDILSVYAVMGFGLLLFRRRSDKALLLWSLVLMFAVPLVVLTLLKYVPILFTSREAAEAATKAAAETSTAVKAQALTGFESGSYVAAMRGNAHFVVHDFLQPSMTWFFVATLGKFLLGFYAGRRRLFHEPERHLGFFRRLLGWSLAVGVVGSGFFSVLRYLSRSERIKGELSWGFLLPPMRQVGELALGIFYVSAITLLFQKPAWKRALSVFAPAGRMALSNYLSQTVLALLLFYGFGLGLLGKLGTAVTLGITAGLFAVQMLTSRLWLSRFQFGPAEWLWRSLTYGRAQPMRLRSAQTEAAPAISS